MERLQAVAVFNNSDTPQRVTIYRANTALLCTALGSGGVWTWVAADHNELVANKKWQLRAEVPDNVRVHMYWADDTLTTFG